MFDLLRLGYPRAIEFKGDDGNPQRWLLVYLVGSSTKKGWSVYIATDASAPLPAQLSLIIAPDDATDISSSFRVEIPNG